jgi:uncharacterized integral membrane protein
VKIRTPCAAPLRYFRFIVMIFTAFFVMAFMLENQEAIGLQILGWSMPKLPVSLYMLLSLLIGLAVGPLLAWYASLRRSRT